MSTEFLLVGDIGGTKADVALVSPRSSQIKARQRFALTAESNLPDLVTSFVTTHNAKPLAAAFGAAGTVHGDRVLLTNLGWEVSAPELARSLSGIPVRVVNDMTAHAYGTLDTPSDKTICLQQGHPASTGNKAVIAVGTGLGEGALVWDGHHYVGFGSEGGHASFSPQNKEQLALLEFAWQKYPHVSAERLISGRLGFPIIADFFLSKANQTSLELKNLLRDTPPEKIASAIQHHAEKGVAACEQILSLFVCLIGAEAGNLALKTMATSGVYITGGVARHLQRWIVDGTLIRSFVAKGRFQTLLEQMPVYLITDSDNALRGLGKLGAQLIAKDRAHGLR